MKLKADIKLKTALTALAAVLLTTGSAIAAPTTDLLVTHYSFDRAPAADGTIAEQSGRGLPLRVRSADGGTVSYIPRGTGRALDLPARCVATAATCPRVVLEAGDDADLDPGARAFRFGAWIRSTPAEAGPSANVMQKGVATAESQWKLQVGGRRGRATCVVVGRGSTTAYIAKSSNSVTDGAWHQITCRRTGTTLTIFVDQVARGSVTLPAGLTISNAMPLRLGGQNLSDRTDHFGGALDEPFVVLM